jgi:Tfp pilus assembly protein PilO
MNPNEISKLKDKAPLPLFFLVVLFFLPSIILEPEAADLKSAAMRFDNCLKSARNAIVVREKLRHRTERKQRLDEVRGELERIIPQETALPQLIDELYRLAVDNSVLLDNVSYSVQKEYEKLLVPGCRIVMNLSSNYMNMRNYIAAIENLKFPVLINEVVLSESNRYVLTMRLLIQ